MEEVGGVGDGKRIANGVELESFEKGVVEEIFGGIGVEVGVGEEDLEILILEIVEDILEAIKLKSEVTEVLERKSSILELKGIFLELINVVGEEVFKAKDGNFEEID